MPVPYQPISEADLKDPLVSNLNLVMRTHTDELNRLGGLNGPVDIVSDLSVGDNQLAAGSISLSGAQLYSGTGSPEGKVAAPVGSMYLNQGGGTGQTLWIKESGTGSSGWIAK